MSVQQQKKEAGKPAEETMNNEGFFQSDDEFSLDIAPRSKQAMLRHVERMDSMSIEPETADFLRGYMIGKFQSLD